MDVLLQKKRLIDLVDDFSLLSNLPSDELYKKIFKKLINLGAEVATERIAKYPGRPSLYEEDGYEGIITIKPPPVCPTCNRKHYAEKNSEDKLVRNGSHYRKSISRKSS